MATISKNLFSDPQATWGDAVFQGKILRGSGWGAGGEGDPSVPPAVTFIPCEIQALGERPPQNSLQSPSVTGQSNAVSKDPGEGQQNASQLQHLLDIISTRIWLTVLC